MVQNGWSPTQQTAESVLHSLLAEYIAPDCSSFSSCAPGVAGEQQHRALGPVWGCALCLEVLALVCLSVPHLVRRMGGELRYKCRHLSPV